MASAFGMRSRPSSPQDKQDLLKAARLVVSALGYEGLSDLEAANVLHSHAQDLKRYRAGGNLAALSFAEKEPAPSDSACKVAGELPVTAEDVRALLELQGLPVLRPEDLQRAVANSVLLGVACIRGAGAFAGAGTRSGRTVSPRLRGLHAIAGLRVQWGARWSHWGAGLGVRAAGLCAWAVLRSMQAKGVCCD